MDIEALNRLCDEEIRLREIYDLDCQSEQHLENLNIARKNLNQRLTAKLVKEIIERVMTAEKCLVDIKVGDMPASIDCHEFAARYFDALQQGDGR